MQDAFGVSRDEHIVSKGGVPVEKAFNPVKAAKSAKQVSRGLKLVKATKGTTVTGGRNSQFLGAAKVSSRRVANEQAEVGGRTRSIHNSPASTRMDDFATASKNRNAWVAQRGRVIQKRTPGSPPPKAW